jgi:hypothetical protein
MNDELIVLLVSGIEMIHNIAPADVRPLCGLPRLSSALEPHTDHEWTNRRP